MTVSLQDYDWSGSQETDRKWVPDEPRGPEDKRGPFERDRARIIHSVAFRRLQGKTQIFASSTDFLRTRVTHSIEVAQIGRALARTFGVNESLVEAACLGHDLGHPPFGHTGEEVLRALMADIGESLQDTQRLRRPRWLGGNRALSADDPGTFEGNAQSFRLVTRLEEKSADFTGLDLCRATLQALLKYPYRVAADHSKFLYDDDANAYEEWLFEGTDEGLLTTFDPTSDPPRTLPCQLMDWADDVAYSVHDLEDGIASEVLQPWRWDTDAFTEAIRGAMAKVPQIRWKGDEPPSLDVISSIVIDLQKRLLDPPVASAEYIPLDVIRDVTGHYIDRFTRAPTIERVGPGNSLYDYKLVVDEDIRIQNQVLKTITFEFVIDNAETRRHAFKGKEILRRLFTALYENTLSEAGRDQLLLFPRSMRGSLATLSPGQAARAVCDYLAGMTEGQALLLYARLFEPSAGLEFGHV